MQMTERILSMKNHFKRWFHKRNIIIISERQVNHVPISGKTQFCTVMLVAGAICWGSYSTGSFMAARSMLKEQSQTLRSVANARVEANLNPLLKVSMLAASDTDAPVNPVGAMPANDPMYTLSALDHNRMSARIAFLEHKIAELKDTNAAIIQRVSDKTSGRIDDLETIIRQTGLNPDALKKEAIANKPKPHHAAEAEGGPYIAADAVSISTEEYKLYDDLDKLATLRRIVNNLPLGEPVEDAERESPFGHRIDPFTGHLAFHSGLDLKGAPNAEIHATAAGRVVSAGPSGAYGNAVDIDHGFGLVTRYGHMSKVLVEEGQTVAKGEVIGIQGSTGRSTGPHVHYEVRYHDQAMNPNNFLVAGQYVSEE